MHIVKGIEDETALGKPVAVYTYPLTQGARLIGGRRRAQPQHFAHGRFEQRAIVQISRT
jgi:hypothetical protein